MVSLGVGREKISNSEGKNVYGQETAVDRNDIRSTIDGLSRGLKLSDIGRDYRKSADKYELRLVNRGGSEFLQLRRKPGRLKAFFASSATKARVTEERRNAMALVSSAFGNSMGLQKLLAAARDDNAKMAATVRFAMSEDRSVGAEDVKHLLAMSEDEYAASRYAREAIDGSRLHIPGDGDGGHQPAQGVDLQQLEVPVAAENSAPSGLIPSGDQVPEKSVVLDGKADEDSEKIRTSSGDDLFSHVQYRNFLLSQINKMNK